MNLFRSEEHVRNWPLFNPASADTIMPLRDWVTLYSSEHRKHLLDGDYMSRYFPNRGAERRAILEHLGKTGSFWFSRLG